MGGVGLFVYSMSNVTLSSWVILWSIGKDDGIIDDIGDVWKHGPSGHSEQIEGKLPNNFL